MTTILEAVGNYLETVKLARSEKTWMAYATAMKNFVLTLTDHDIDVEKEDVQGLSEEVITWFANDLKGYAATSEQLYITALKGFLEYLVAEELATHLSAVGSETSSHRLRRSGV